MKSEIGKELLVWAGEKHAATGQTYGDLPYTYHLVRNVEVLALFGFDSELDEKVAVCHDLLEDTDVTFEELIEKIGDEAALICWAMSGGKGNRKTRMARIKNRIQMVPRAARYKAVDRIVNMEYSSENNPGLFKMYQKEFDDFIEYINVLIPLTIVLRLMMANDMNIDKALTILQGGSDLGVSDV